VTDYDARDRLRADAKPLRPRQDDTPAPRELAITWTLQKNGHHAECRVVEHQLGVEPRVLVDGDLRRSEVVRHPRMMQDPVPQVAVILAADWRQQWIMKGWTR
jgi:hypothetical protein